MFSLKLTLNVLTIGNNYILAVPSLKSDRYDKVLSAGDKMIFKKKNEQKELPSQKPQLVNLYTLVR
jgi:hypothetical protein